MNPAALLGVAYVSVLAIELVALAAYLIVCAVRRWSIRRAANRTVPRAVVLRGPYTRCSPPVAVRLVGTKGHWPR